MKNYAGSEFITQNLFENSRLPKHVLVWRKGAVETHQPCLQPAAWMRTPALPTKTYQNGCDDQRPVSQGVGDVGRPVFVAVRHVKAAVGVPDADLHRTKLVRACLSAAHWLG